MTEPGSNGGIYFHTQYQETGWPKAGFECQVNVSHGDWIKTGSLYGFPKFADKTVIKEMLVKPDEWFTQEVIAKGNHIIIKVNDKKTVDFVDQNNTYKRGHFALQQHGAIKEKGKEYETVLHVRKIEVKELPPSP